MFVQEHIVCQTKIWFRGDETNCSNYNEITYPKYGCNKLLKPEETNSIAIVKIPTLLNIRRPTPKHEGNMFLVVCI
jgi:hypothetical protein